MIIALKLIDVPDGRIVVPFGQTLFVLAGSISQTTKNPARTFTVHPPGICEGLQYRSSHVYMYMYLCTGVYVYFFLFFYL